MKTALIFGITGQDGSYLARFLLSKGYKVVGTSRYPDASRYGCLISLGILDSLHILPVAPHDFHKVLDVITQYSPDEIYNLSGQTSVGLSFDLPVETLESNAIATLHILEAVRYLKSPARIYNASSTEIFGNYSGVPFSEESPLVPKSPYALSKATAFWNTSIYREAFNIHACSGILSNHESPMRPDFFVTKRIVKAVHLIAQGEISSLELGSLDIVRDWGWVEEYVEAMWMMLQHSSPNDYVIATGRSYSLRDFVDYAFSLMNLDYRQFVVVNTSLARPMDNRICIVNPSKAASLLPWQAQIDMYGVIDRLISLYT